MSPFTILPTFIHRRENHANAKDWTTPQHSRRHHGTSRTILAAGGQGEVYEVTSAGRHYALKWYFYPTTAEQTTQLEEMKNAFSLEGPFSQAPPDSRFLWPITMVNDPRNRTFGYLMPLLPREYQGLERLVLGKCVQYPIFTSCVQPLSNWHSL